MSRSIIEIYGWKLQLTKIMDMSNIKHEVFVSEILDQFI